MTMIDQEHLGAYRFAPEGTTSRVLFVGEDNPLSSDPKFALYCYPQGCAGQRFQELILGMRMSDYLACWRTNLCMHRWSAANAQIRALELLKGVHPWDVVVLLGRKVADIFSRVDNNPFRWEPFTERPMPRRVIETPGNFTVDMIPVISLPHPSGRNTVWNDLARRFEARRLLAEYAPELWAQPST